MKIQYGGEELGKPEQGILPEGSAHMAGEEDMTRRLCPHGW